VFYRGVHTKGRTYAEGVQEQGAEADIWAQREEVTGDWENCTNRNFMNHTPHQILLE
jgi:hypothetical protein